MSRPRVVYAHQKGMFKPEVLELLRSEPIELEVAAHEGDEGYYHLLERLWDQAESFVMVEWDNLPYAGAIQEIWDCPEVFCGKPYRIGHFYAACFGCTKFSAELMRTYPQAIRLGGARLQPNFGMPGYKHWGSLDSRVIDALRSLGFEGELNWGGWNWGWPHQHWPTVEHLHDYPGVPQPRNGPLPPGTKINPGAPQQTADMRAWRGVNLQISFGFYAARNLRRALTGDRQQGSEPLPAEAFRLLDRAGVELAPVTFWVPEQQGPTLGQVFCQISAELAGPPLAFAHKVEVCFPDGERVLSDRVLAPVLEFGERLPLLGRH